jgi:putative hydrolase of the HAD superfamily
MKYGISFDFWNTLYGDGSEENRFAQRVKYLLNIINHYRPVDEEDIVAAFSASTEFFLHEWKNNNRTPSAEERIAFMADKLKVKINEELMKQIEGYFGDLIFKVPPREIKPIKSIIPELAREFPLGIISDTGYISGKYIRRFLEMEGLCSYFNAMIFSDEQQHSKPHYSVFELMAAELNISINNLIHIGDLERTDIEGALNAGCSCIRYVGEKHSKPVESKANIMINDYKYLTQSLHRLMTN